MEKGCLSKCFDNCIVKVMVNSDLDRGTSKQHEFNGVSKLKSIFGEDKITVNASFYHLYDDKPMVKRTGNVTWYDARKNNPSKTEYRLYYYEDTEFGLISPGEIIYVLLRKSDTKSIVVDILIMPFESAISHDAAYLLGIDKTTNLPPITLDSSTHSDKLEYNFNVINSILSSSKPTYRIPKVNLPPDSRRVSEFTRSLLNGLDPVINPDEYLRNCCVQEVELYNNESDETLNKEFDCHDVSDDTIRNHLKYIFNKNGILYEDRKTHFYLGNNGTADYFFIFTQNCDLLIDFIKTRDLNSTTYALAVTPEIEQVIKDYALEDVGEVSFHVKNADKNNHSLKDYINFIHSIQEAIE